MSSRKRLFQDRRGPRPRKPGLEPLERREMLSNVPTLGSPGVHQVGLGTYTDTFPDNANYPEYLSPIQMDYHPPTTIFLSGVGSSPSLVFPTITPGSPFLDNADPTQNKPVATSEWWSSLMFRREIDQTQPFTAMQPHPLSLLAYPDGLGMAYVTTPVVATVGPNDPRGPGAQFIQYQYPETAPGSGVKLDDLKVGLKELTNRDAGKVTVYDYSDWTVTADWAGKMRATAGHGLPSVYYQFPAGGTAKISFAQSQPATLVQNFGNGALLVKVGSRYYGLFGPTAAAANWDTSSSTQFLLNNLTANTGYLSVALMPDGFNPATDIGTTFALFRSTAYNFVTGSLATYDFDEAGGKVTTTLTLTSTFMDNPADATLNKTTALQALYPHQWLALSNGTASSSLTYTSARGAMKLLTASATPNQFQTTLRYQGILPFLPDVNPNPTYHLNLWNQQVLPYLRLRSAPNQKDDQLDLSNLIRGGDVYSLGQSMLGGAQLVPLLDQIAAALQGSTDPDTQKAAALASKYAADVLARVKGEMGAWLSVTDDDRVKFLYYDRNFNALLATPGAYESSDGVNDQHLGFGYFIKTAALIAQYDPAWAAPEAMGGLIRMIVEEVANPVLDARGQALPRLRNFDPYAGHSWADGSANSDNGNNQESSSEGLNFASGLIQWGEATGDTALRDLGVYLFTTESDSVKYYYFNQQNTSNPASHFTQGYTRPQIAILESVGGEYQTFFDVIPAVVETIQFVPFTGSSFYLADLGTFLDASGQPVVDPNYNELNFQAGVGPAGSNPQNVYQNPLYMYRALQSQAQARASLAYLFDATTGAPKYLPFDGAPGTTYGGNNGVDNPVFNAHWLNLISTFGKPDRTVTADSTLYAVFVADDATTKTYAAYNPTASPLTVTFSDGYVLNVPARSLKTSVGIASNAPAGTGPASLVPERGVVTSPNRLYLSAGAGGSALIGTTGAFESRVAIPGANNGAVKAGIQARIPPDAPSIDFTTTGVNGTYDTTVDPTRPLSFQIWLDGGVIPENILNSQVGLLFEIYNNGGAGATPDYFLRYSEFALPSSSPTGIITGYLTPYDQDFGGGVVDYSGKSAGQSIPNPPDLVNATIKITLYTSLGLTPVSVRVDAAGAQGRLSYIDIPYNIASTDPTVSISSPNSSTVAGAPATFTATIIQAGSAPFTGQVQFFDGATPIGSPITPGAPVTANGITTATATLSGYTGLAAGPRSISARYFTAAGISYVSRTSGGTGQIVKILGTNLTGATSVTFGGVPAQSFTVDSATQITAVVGTGGTGPISVVTPAGTISAASNFSFLSAAAAPSLTDYTPASAGPGAQITLTGTGFTGVSAVKIGGISASFTYASPTQITMILPATAVSGPIEITTPGGIASSADLPDATKRRFLNGGPGPTINTLSVLSGSTGQVVVISGQIFSGATSVTIGGVPVQKFTIDIPTQITAVVGAGASGPVVVTTPSGTTTSYQLFAFGSSNSFLIPSPAMSHEVVAANRAAPTVTVASAYPRIPYATVTTTLSFSATVAAASGSAAPTGAVVFLLDGEAIGTAPVGADGVARFTPDKPFIPGDYQLTARYLGDALFAPTTSAAVPQVVTRINPFIEFVDAVANPIVGGQVILRAKLVSQYASNGYAPSGLIEFYDGNLLLGRGNTTFDPGVFTFTTTFAADPVNPVIHNIRVEYLGDSYYYPDQFPACGYPLTVLPATQTTPISTATTITSMVTDTATAQAVVGQTVFFNASVAASNPPFGYVGYITGKVVFDYAAPTAPGAWVAMDANPEFLLLYYNGLTNTNQSDLAQLPAFKPQAAGAYQIRARYYSQIDFQGDPNPQYLDSVALYTLNVVAPPAGGIYPTSITLTDAVSPGLPPGTTVLDQAIVLTATVTSPNAWASGPFAGLVTADAGQTGSVQFLRNGAVYATIPMNSLGQAVLILPSEPAGTTSWTATFVPAPAFNQFASSTTKATLRHTVQLSDPARLSVVVSPPVGPLTAGQPATFNISVTGQSALGLGVPSGTVQVIVTSGATSYGGTVTLGPNGTATFTTAALPVGNYSYSAVYNADGYDKYFPTGAPNNTSVVQPFRVAAANLPPMNAVPSSARAAVGGEILFSTRTGNPIRVSDPDAGRFSLSVTLTAEHGTVTFASSRGLTFIEGDGRDDARVVVIGTIEDLNTALEDLRFLAQPGYFGAAALRVLTDDRGNTGYGGPQIDLDAIPIELRGPAFAPIADRTVTEGDLVALVASAVDPERPGAEIVYSLDANSLAVGATIDPRTGAFSWRSPGRPQLAFFTVLATEVGLPEFVASRRFSVLSLNVAPEISIPSSAPITRGSVFAAAGSFQDPGDSRWTATVDYGDGSGVVPLALAADKTFVLGHRYDRVGSYVVTVVVSDGLAAGGRATTVLVNDAPVVTARSVELLTVRKNVTGIAVAFDGDLDPTSALQLADYRLRTPGRDGRFGTRDDQFLRLIGTRYDPTTRTVSLALAKPLAKVARYQLLVNSGPVKYPVADAFGRPLDGDRDGKPGGVLTLGIDRTTRRVPDPLSIGFLSTTKALPSPAKIKQNRKIKR